MEVNNGNLQWSLMRALWGNVTPNLRAASIKVESKWITIFFYFERDPNELELELANDSCTEVVADFPQMMIDMKVKITGNESFVREGALVFQRYEPL